MRILVTGGAGFIGSHVVDAYLAAGHDVVVVDNLWQHGGGRLENLPPGVRYYPADISDARALDEVFDRERPEIVNHHAAQHSVKLSADDPRFDAQVNVRGLLNVLEASRRVGTRKVIMASSAATYGTVDHLPANETTPQRPESPYGITKMVAEHYLRFYRSQHGMDFTAFRYGNVYGPRQDPNGEAGVIAIFINRLLRDQPIRIDWDGEQSRDYVFVEDVAQASVRALEAGAGGIYCIGTGEGTSVNTLHDHLVRLTGHNPPVEHAPKRDGDIRATLFDCTLAREELGWQPKVRIDEGLRRTVDYFNAKTGAEQAIGTTAARAR